MACRHALVKISAVQNIQAVATWSFSDVAFTDEDLGCLNKAPMQQIAQDVAVQPAN